MSGNRDRLRCGHEVFTPGCPDCAAWAAARRDGWIDSPPSKHTLDDTGSNSLLDTAAGLDEQADRLERMAKAMRAQASVIRVVLERAKS